MSIKKECKRIKGEGYYLLTQGVKVPVKIFMNPELFEDCVPVDPWQSVEGVHGPVTRLGRSRADAKGLED